MTAWRPRCRSRSPALPPRARPRRCATWSSSSRAPNRSPVVGMPMWPWVRQGPTTYGPATATASAGGVTVIATAKVTSIRWDMGDGTTVTCAGSGTPYRDGAGVADSLGCGHRYIQVSSGRIDANSELAEHGRVPAPRSGTPRAAAAEPSSSSGRTSSAPARRSAWSRVSRVPEPRSRTTMGVAASSSTRRELRRRAQGWSGTTTTRRHRPAHPPGTTRPHQRKVPAGPLRERHQTPPAARSICRHSWR